MQVVEFARDLFLEGDAHARTPARVFDRVYALFDRDEHESYHAALTTASALDGKLRNDEKKFIRFLAVASVPCFELWLLLHFEDVLAPLHRDEAVARLRIHLKNYAKGSGGHFAQTHRALPDALARAQKLAAQHGAANGMQPYTDVAELVAWLSSLKPAG